MIIYFIMYTRWYSGELTTPNDRNSYRFIKQITLKTELGRREQWLVDYIVSDDKRNFRDCVTNNYYFTNDSNKTNKNCGQRSYLKCLISGLFRDCVRSELLNDTYCSTSPRGQSNRNCHDMDIGNFKGSLNVLMCRLRNIIYYCHQPSQFTSFTASIICMLDFPLSQSRNNTWIHLLNFKHYNSLRTKNC